MLDAPLGREVKTPSQVMAEAEERELLEEALHQLEEVDRLLVVRRKILGEDYESLAEELGITAGAVRMRVHRAIARAAAWVERRRPRTS
jgi:RNA polymerase sigma-70 factor (ECF subfamily)